MKQNRNASSSIRWPTKTVGAVRVVALWQSSVEDHSTVGVEFREAARLTPSHECVAVIQGLSAALREH